MNLILLALFGILALVLIVLLIMRNKKDKNEFENYLNNDYPKTKDKEGDLELD